MKVFCKIKDSVNIPISYGNWCDLHTAEPVTLKRGEYRVIDLGVAMKLPQGYEALLVPRSSTFKNYGVIMVNSVGVIDNEYSGDNDYWGFPVIATKDITIPKNVRIAQFRIIKSEKYLLAIVSELGNKDRGGFGSTGK